MLTFIVAGLPKKPRFRTSIPRHQPTSTKLPTKTAIALATLATSAFVEILNLSCSRKRLIFNIECSLTASI
ncbi:hypothetical protein [Nostoc sp. DSM 114160]